MAELEYQKLPNEIKCKILQDINDIDDIKQLSKTNVESYSLIKENVIEINGSSFLRTTCDDPPVSTITSFQKLERINIPVHLTSFYALFQMGQMSKLEKVCFEIGEIDYTSAILAFLDTYSHPSSGKHRGKLSGQFLFYDANFSDRLVHINQNRLTISDLELDYSLTKISRFEDLVDDLCHHLYSSITIIVLDLKFITPKIIEAIENLFSSYTNPRYDKLVLGVTATQTMHALFHVPKFLIIYSIDSLPINLSEYISAGSTFSNVEIMLGLINLDDFLSIQDSFPNLKVLHAFIGSNTQTNVLTYLSQLNPNITTINLLTTDPSFTLPPVPGHTTLITLNSSAYILNYLTVFNSYGLRVATNGS